MTARRGDAGETSSFSPPPRTRCVSSDLSPGEELPAGFEFGRDGARYEILTLLGQGAFAKVYKCQADEDNTDELSHDAFAVKVVELQRLRFLPDFEKQQEMLHREVEILRDLRHEKIVNMLDFFMTEEHWYMVMELVCHGELFHLIKPNRGMRELEAKYVFQQLLEGIGYIHSKGVIHRDLKPENILIVRTQQLQQETAAGPVTFNLHDVKIADFGLSKVRGGDFSMAQSRVGTPIYAAPEIFSGIYAEEVDMWSLGAILYVMLCGMYPFDGRSLPREILLGVVAEVRGRCGAEGVTAVELVRHDGIVRAYGGAGGLSVGPWLLQPEEHIIAALQEGVTTNVALANSLTLFTNSGRIMALDSPKAARYARFMAPPRSQISGLDFEGAELVGVRTAAVRTSGLGVVLSVGGRAGSMVDSMEIRRRDQTSDQHGGEGGTALGPWPLEEDEQILAVVQEPSGLHLGYAFFFFTSKGNVIALTGKGARRVSHDAVPSHKQLDRLAFGPEGWLCSAPAVAEEAQIRCANFKLDSPVWKQLSDNAKMVVCGLLRVNPDARQRLEACLHLPWLDDALLPSKEESFSEFIKRGSQNFLIDKAQVDAQAISEEEPPSLDLSPEDSCTGLSTTTSPKSSAREVSASFAAALADPPDPPTPCAGAAAGDAETPAATPNGGGSTPGTVRRSPSKDMKDGGSPNRVLRAGSKGEANPNYSAVATIRGRLDSAVDRVEFQLWTGQTLAYGGHGGGPVGPWKLKPDEYIMAVEQEYRESDLGYLGNEIAFFTSRGKVITIGGTFAKQAHRFAASSGMQVCGLQFNGSALCGIETQPVDDGPGVIQQVIGRLADCVDQVELIFRNGSVRTYGGAGGQKQSPCTLSHGEYITAVSQEHYEQYLGNAFAFFTSAGNVVRIDGRQAGRRARFAAASGSQIWGLRFEGSRLAKVIARPFALRGRNGGLGGNSFDGKAVTPTPGNSFDGKAGR